MLPLRREDGLVVQELSEETVVYDELRHQAHCLNRAAALVWRHCDGRTSVAQLARLLHEDLGVPADERLVWHALVRLEKAHLLARNLPAGKAVGRLSRRDLVKMGVAAIAVPVVMTILAPSVAMAASCCGNACVMAANCCPTCPICNANACVTGA